MGEGVGWRRDTGTRRLTHRLEQVMDRLHILEGYLIAFLNIDEVIRIIREEDAPKIELMKRFALSETQANAVLDLRLRHLAKLEEVKIHTEQKELESEREYLESILGSHTKMTKLIRDELTKDAENYGDDRRSPIVVRQEARALREDEEQARAVEERVRAQVEARARRHGEQTARREAAEAVRQAEERARAATQAAEEKALRAEGTC